MTKKALWIAMPAVALVAAGCSELMAQGKAKPSYESATSAQTCDTQADCPVTVTIDTGQSPCKAVVKPEITLVHNVHNVRIVWTLDAPDGYKFVYLRFKDEEKAYVAQNASRITLPSRDQFYGRKMSAREVEMRDKNTKNGSWYYELSVSNGTTTCDVDPPMVNG